MLAVLKVYSLKDGLNLTQNENREYVITFIQGLPFEVKCIANEKKLDENPTVDEPIIPFETLKNFVKRKRLAYEMTPKSSNNVNYLEPQERYSHKSRSQTRYQTDTDYKGSPQFNKFCKYCTKKSHSLSLSIL